ncbi:VanZ family protein [Enterococcus sp. LJL120]
MKKNKAAGILLLCYLVVVVWIILFKVATSVNTVQFFLEHPSRSLNLIPFGESVIVNGKIYLQEIIYNTLIFVPFGGLLSLYDKRSSLIKKLLYIFSFSLLLETAQYVLGIGASDITDVLVNTLGGLIGLLIYQLLKLFVPEVKLDRLLLRLGSVIFLAGLLFICFMLLVN